MGLRGKQPMPYSAEYVREHIQARIAIEDHGHETPCWIWQKGITGSGYATGRPAGCTTHGLMHRRSYEASVGPIPDGLVLDHLCRQTACVNPAHLEAVTQSENMLRAPFRGRMVKAVALNIMGGGGADNRATATTRTGNALTHSGGVL